MKVLITGATGFVGSRLVKSLLDQGHEVVGLTRHVPRATLKLGSKVSLFKWKGESELVPEAAFEGVTGVINLVGENISNGRWDEGHKKRIYDSRILSTKNLVESINKFGSLVTSFVSTSAIGIYGDQDASLEIDEDTEVKEIDFLSKVCIDWEKASSSNLNSNVRLVNLRVGIVLGEEGGALSKMMLPFKMGAGGVVGSGKQIMSWVHVDDLVNLYIWSLTQEVDGVINATAPRPVSNKVFTKTLGKVLKRPTIFPLPGFVAEVVFGDMATILIEGQKVLPRKAMKNGFNFTYDTVEKAFKEITN